MASAIPPILVQIQADVAQLKAGMAQAEASVKGLDGSVKTASTGMSNMIANAKRMAGAMGVAFAATQVVQFGKDVVMAASNMNESLSKMHVVFGENADAVEQFGNKSATSIGISKQAAIEAAGTYGNLFQAFGVGQGKATEMSTTLVKLAGDLASFNNTSVEDAINALRSGLSGETEPLKRFGVALNDVTLKNKAMAMGFGEIKGAMDPAIKAQVTYALVMEQTKLAQGDFERTSSGTANTMKILQAQMENAKAALGAGLLPVFQAILLIMKPLISGLAAFGNLLAKHGDDVKVFTIAVLAFAAGWGVYTLAVNAAKIATATLNAVLAINPFVAIAIAIGAVAVGLYELYKRSDAFRKAINTIFSAMVGALGQFIGAIATVFEAASKIPGIGSKFDGVAKAIRGASDNMKEFALNVGKVKQAQSTSNAALGLSGSAFDSKSVANGGGGGGGGGKATAKEIAAAAKKKADALAKLYDDVQKTYDKMDKVISDSGEKRVKITAAYDDKVLKLKADSAKKVAALENKAFEDRNAAEIKAANDRINIIAKGQDMLRNAFATGAAFDLAEMFKDTDKSGANLLSMMKGKFASIKRLKDQAYALASAGFSQTFIQEIVKNGPGVGSEMAAAILSSSPEVQAGLKEVFYGLEDVSKYGLDALAEQMSTSTSFATQELMDEYNNVAVQLEDTLSNINSNLRAALDEEATNLKDALLEAQADFNAAITELEKDTMDKLKTLQDELAKTAAKIAELSGKSAAVSITAGSPAAPYLAGVTPLGGGATENPFAQNDNPQIVIKQTNNINGQTSAADITSATVSAIKFGSVGSIGMRYAQSQALL
jgi:hypothetical protein